MKPADFIQRFNLRGRTVLETGCLFGHHTVQLLAAGANVIAVDCREENLAITKRACDEEELVPELHKADLETWTFPLVAGCWHSGTLYHLADPEAHIARNFPLIDSALFLSTHYSPDGRPHRHRETPSMPRAGLSPLSLWLPRQRILDLTREHGFTIEIVRDEVERHGPRIELLAWR